MKHGGSGHAYTYYGCRCQECTDANTARNKRRRTERVAATKDPTDPRHGSPSFYSNHGCRCETCKAGWSVEMKRQYDDRKEREATA